jgi:hypothetical protein
VQVMRVAAIGMLMAMVGACVGNAQVITPMELQDPKMQHLQQRHLQTLMVIGKEIEEHKFPYSFYLCRALDVDLSKLQTADLRSIRFDSFEHQTVLAISGNYYASYSAERMDADARLKETFKQVIVPILRIETPHFPDDSEFSAFAIEVSHHVRQKVMGVMSEMPENLVLVIPVASAQHFVDAKNDDERQGAMLESQVFVNGEPHALWLGDGAPTEEWRERNAPRSAQKQAAALVNASSPSASETPHVASALLKSTPPRIITPETLAGLQRQNQDAIDRMVKAMNSEAHFFSYAPPSFIGFRQGSYLQLPMSTSLEADPTSSRYKVAALAFDDHIAHLIRPLMTYFTDGVEFDGVDFSTSIHMTGKDKSEAVEFFFPYRVMRCFASYDCTGQQLLDSGTVVIDGERATLDLQVAEGKN